MSAIFDQFVRRVYARRCIALSQSIDRIMPTGADLEPMANSNRAPRRADIAAVRPTMRAFGRGNAAHGAALERLRGWVRQRFALGQDSTVMVAEVACALPGCPPLETVIAFWSDDRRHHLKVFKPLLQVTEDDLPPGWLKPALAVPDDFECGCC
jgi:hypothetical protein